MDAEEPNNDLQSRAGLGSVRSGISTTAVKWDESRAPLFSSPASEIVNDSLPVRCLRSSIHFM